MGAATAESGDEMRCGLSNEHPHWIDKGCIALNK
jgi:hypothetical protein